MKYFKLNLTLASILLIIIALINSWIALDRIKKENKEKTSKYLNALLEAACNGYESWSERHIASAYIWEPLVEIYTKELLKISHSAEELVNSHFQTEIRNLLKPVYTNTMGDFEDFCIIRPDNIILASSQVRNIGRIHLLASQEVILQRMWAGEKLISSPMRSDIPLQAKDGTLVEGRAIMFMGMPVKDDSGEVIAILIFGINPDKEFTQIFQKGRIGKSGEAYGINREGLMLTNSRFPEQLEKIGLLQPGETEILNLKVADPGINLLKEEGGIPEDKRSLTKMAQSIADGKSGFDLEGYRDYRGVKVIGAWNWNEDKGFGITIEVNYDEAFLDYYFTGKTIIILTLLGIGVVLSQLFLFYWLYGKVIKNEKVYKEAERIGKIGHWNYNFKTGKSHCSENYYRLFGYEPFGFEASFNNFKTRVFPEDLHIIENGLKRIQEEMKEMNFEFRIVTKDDTIAWHMYQVIPEFDQGKLILVRGTAQDITESKIAELSIIESEAKFRIVTELNPAAIFIVQDGHLVFVNSSATIQTGYNQDELIGMNYLDLVHPDHWEMVALNAKNRLAGLQVPERYELKFVTKSGRNLWLDFLPQLISYEGKPSIMATGVDITERIHAEELLVKKYESEKIIAETSSNFINLPANKLNSAIEDTLARIGKLVRADRSYIFQFSGDGTVMTNTNEWCAKGIEPLIDNSKEFTVDAFPWLMKKLNQTEVIQVSKAADLPPEAIAVKKILQVRQIQSLVVIPMIQNKRIYGFIGLDSVQTERLWDEQEIVMLKLITEIFSNAIIRAKTEQTILKSNSLLERVFASTEFMLAYLDPSFNFIRVNNAYAEKDGFSPDFYEGKNHFDLYPHEENEKIFRRVVETGEIYSVKSKPFINPLHPERGTTYWDWTLNPIKEESVLVSGLILSLSDVTQPKRDEENVRKLNTELELKVQERTKELEYINNHLQKEILENENAEKRISLVYDSSPYSIILINSFGIIQMANLTSEIYFGYKKDQLVGENIHKLVPKENNSNHTSLINHFFQNPSNRGMGAGRDLYALKNDGTKFPVEIGLTPIEMDGEMMVMANIIDITERKKAEEKIVQAKSEAEEANKAKSLFLANMSHEIRTPMNAIIGFSDLLYSSLKEEKQRSQVETIRSSSRNLLRIINDILDLSKIEAGKLVIQKQVVDVHKLAVEMERVFSHKTSEKGISFFIETESRIPPLMLDETRLRQILFNLLGNAFKFTEKGQVILTLDKKEKTGNTIDLIIKIEDTGIGIPKKQQELIFEAFTQQDELIGSKYGGTGLGLAITKRLVEMMNGKISVSSKPGQGSIFTVYLPHLEINMDETYRSFNEIPTFDPSSVIFEKAKVLVVDDIKTNRNLIISLLNYSPITVFEAENGKEAVEIATQHLPDLILMDLRMPEMNGYEATRILKKQENTKAIPVIAVTASIKIIMKSDKSLDIFNDFMLKPIELAELTELIKKYLKYKVVKEKEISETGEPLGIKLEISNTLKKNLKNIIAILEKKFIPLHDKAIKTQMIDQIEQFGKDLTVFAEKQSFESLRQYGNKISTLADNFEINKLMETLKKFPGIIKELKSQNHN